MDVNRMYTSHAKEKTDKHPAFFPGATPAPPTRRALELTAFYDPKTDPSGSYTGRPVESHEPPVQDADDL